MQIEPSKSEGVKFSIYKSVPNNSDITAQLGNVYKWEHQICNLLKKAPMTIPKTSKSGKILHPTKIATFDTSTQHGKAPESVTTVNFAIHVCCSYKGYCNTLPVSSGFLYYLGAYQGYLLHLFL